MPRILGVDLPNDKPTHISLRYLYGIGPTRSLELCEKARVDPQRRAGELDAEEGARPATPLDPRPPEEHRLLPGHAPPAQSAGARTTDAYQRPDPEGPAQDRGGQEGREG